MSHSDTPLSPQNALVELHGDEVMTSLRRVDSAIEVRIFNPTIAHTEVQLYFGNTLQLQRAFAVDFESNPTGEELAVNDNTVIAKLATK